MKFVERNKDNKEWFVVAVEKEFTSDTYNVAYSDVGKVNAAMTTQKLIDTYHPTKITNIGTAGARPGIPTGQIHAISVVADRDLQIPGRTPNVIITATPGRQICYTGDSFVKNWDHVEYNIVDMEAYAIAQVCKENKVSFQCYKYISDNGNDLDWERAAFDCTMAFREMLKERKRICMKNSKGSK